MACSAAPPHGELLLRRGAYTEERMRRRENAWGRSRDLNTARSPQGLSGLGDLHGEHAISHAGVDGGREGVSGSAQRRAVVSRTAVTAAELADLEVKPTSMIDISDGLASECLHIVAASGVGVRV